MSRAFALAAPLLFAACTTGLVVGPDPDAAAPARDLGAADLAGPSRDQGGLGGIVTHTVLPHLTDPTITMPDDTHLAYAPAVSNGHLLVFFPGSGGVPSGYERFMQLAAQIGYHVVGVDYPNKTGSVATQCDTDVACYGLLRAETWSGQDRSPIIDVDVANSIHNRVVKLLAYLVTEYPGEGWDAFVAPGGEPLWAKIAVSGHSQGGGHAAYIASLYAVARVVMFSSVSDASGATSPPTPATWIGAGHVTPSSAYFGVDHQDDAAFHAKCLADWAALAMPGALVDADTVAAPYNGSHRLTASRPLTSPHNQIVGDGVPLDANGVPVFANLWAYLIGP